MYVCACKHSQRAEETACSDWSLLSWLDTLDFCAASVGNCQTKGKKSLASLRAIQTPHEDQTNVSASYLHLTSCEGSRQKQELLLVEFNKMYISLL